MKKSWAILALALFAWGCASSPDKGMVSTKGEIEKEWVEEGMTKDAFFARGIGAADQALTNKTQKMATSRNAAIVNAQYNMLTLLKGANLEGGIAVSKAIESDSQLETSINAVIKGAQIVKTEWTSDDGCVVVLKLPKNILRETGIKLAE